MPHPISPFYFCLSNATAPLQADLCNNLIRHVVLSSGLVSTLAGNTSGATGSADGLGTNASFYGPVSVAMDAAGTVALIVSIAWRCEGQGIRSCVYVESCVKF